MVVKPGRRFAVAIPFHASRFFQSSPLSLVFLLFPASFVEAVGWVSAELVVAAFCVQAALTS